VQQIATEVIFGAKLVQRFTVCLLMLAQDNKPVCESPFSTIQKV